jgi:hypothetical protein
MQPVQRKLLAIEQRESKLFAARYAFWRIEKRNLPSSDAELSRDDLQGTDVLQTSSLESLSRSVSSNDRRNTTQDPTVPEK